ncbi:hypothetical protein JOB18_001760 [Solea senegalensis]|uniref:Uncharacterized protein n=1 Tax=Solea senegalensis TaxID=28829 RepID=A0AAV6QU41_SOLSE|nr:hypothetical protein JOB18_001760 [Solea senegalensis]
MYKQELWELSGPVVSFTSFSGLNEMNDPHTMCLKSSRKRAGQDSTESWVSRQWSTRDRSCHKDESKTASATQPRTYLKVQEVVGTWLVSIATNPVDEC